MARAASVPLVVALLLGALVIVAPAAAAQTPSVGVDPMRVGLVGGAQFRGFVSVTNPTDVAETYMLSASAGNVRISFDRASVTVEPAKTERVGFLFQVPRDHEAREVLARFDVTGPAGVAQAFLIANVSAYEDGGLDGGMLPAADASGMGAAITDGGVFEGQFRVTSQNTTSTRAYPVSLVAPAGWDATVTPSELALAPGETTTVRFRAVPTAAAVNGTGAVMIGTRHVHTAVALSFNITHENASDPDPLPGLPDMSTLVDEVSVPVGGSAQVQLRLRDTSGQGWTGTVATRVDGPFHVAATQDASVEPFGETIVPFLVSANLAASPNILGQVEFLIGDRGVTQELRVTTRPDPAPWLRIEGDRREIAVADKASELLRVTVSNDGPEAWQGDILFSSSSEEVVVVGRAEVLVPAGGSATTQFAFSSRTGIAARLPAETQVWFQVPEARWDVVVRPDVPTPRTTIVLRVSPETLPLAFGGTAIVHLNATNEGNATWSGSVTLDAPPGVDVAFATETLTLAPGETRTSLIAVTSLSEEPVLVTFAADDARALLEVVPPAPVSPETDEDDASGVGGGAVALAAVGGVAVVSGALAAAPRRWPLAFAGLYARLAGSRLLEHPVRRRIRTLVEQTPGITHNEIGRQLELERGVLDHHLTKLLASGLVASVPDGQLRRHYAPGSALPQARAALDARILAALPARGEATASEVAASLGVTRQAMHYHLRRMVRDGRLAARRAQGGLVLSRVA